MKQKATARLFAHMCCVVFLTTLLASCGTSRKINTNYLYFSYGTDTIIAEQKSITIKPNDLLSIQVYSKTMNQEQAAIFNLQPSANKETQGYSVTTKGNIEMPVIGNIKVAGLTKDQVQELLVQKLTDYVKNPSVLVKFLQFNVNVLGEVRTPGTQKFFTDKVTIIDAISAAGDLTDYGKREDVTVIREEGQQKIYYTVDLRKRDFFQSPVYMLQPNDIVYVGPTKTKLRNLTVDPDSIRRTSLLITVLSVIISVATLVITASK